MKRGTAVLGGAALVALVLGGAWMVTMRGPWSLIGRPETPGSGRAAQAPWTMAQLRDLLTAIRSAEREGLRPSDYRLDEVRAAVAANRQAPAVDALAGAAALALAQDFAAGRVRNRHRFNWYIDRPVPDAAVMTAGITDARLHGRLGTWLAGLLPVSADYRSLRIALAATASDNEERRNRIIANMERWRWLPRAFGQGDQLYVNLPTYRLDMVSGGQVVASYRAVIGATDMPTPSLSATVRQVIANPDWIVPQSIVRRSHLTPGSSSRYIFSTRPNGTLRVRQKPGPGNALGRVKIEFPNRLAIYFHDTPGKSLFGADVRTFSHGCVRVQNIEALATSLVAQPARFAAALADTRTRSFTTARPWTATIVYLTLVPAADGSLVDVGDPYHMDEALAAAVQGRKPRRPAPPPITTATASVAPVHPTRPVVPVAPDPAVAPRESTEDPAGVTAPTIGNQL